MCPAGVPEDDSRLRYTKLAMPRFIEKKNKIYLYYFLTFVFEPNTVKCMISSSDTQQPHTYLSVLIKQEVNYLLLPPLRKITYNLSQIPGQVGANKTGP